MNTGWFRAAAAITFTVLFTAAAPGGIGAEDHSPASGPCRSILPGTAGRQEELTYTIKWGLISAGTAVVRLVPGNAASGTGYRIDTEARSSAFIDAIYKVRDKASSLTDGDFKRSLLFSKSQHEGKFSREEVIEYDSVEGVSLLFRDGKLKKTLRLPEEYQDPLSGLFSFRRMRAVPGDTVTMYATDGQRLMLVKGTVLEREQVSVPAGRFSCLKVELFPETLEGPFMRKKHGRLFLWFSDDDCRLPVKFSTEVVIGAVETVLVKVAYPPAPL